MSIRDFNAQRLFVETRLEAGAGIECGPAQANYLKNVLRLKPGDEILLFNGRDGEWRAEVAELDRRAVTFTASEQTRTQAAGPDIDYLFVPLKRARLDYMVQKAAEMGVARLRPVLSRRCVAARVNLERMRANAVEAAEQCGILHIPGVAEPVKLEKALAQWEGDRRLIFCDENSGMAGPIEALQAVLPGPLALLVGPEGGFDDRERKMLLEKPFVTPVGLGPRILRADTAAVAALAIVNAVLGDWR